MIGSNENVTQMYVTLKAEREQYKPLWDQIAQYVGISVDPDYTWAKKQSTKSDVVDEYVDDPTSAISVNQFGDYLLGIMWGTGQRAFNIVPSRYVLELAPQSAVEPWYNYSTSQALYHMNHVDAGLNSSLRPYAYDQTAFGTSGVGAFVNKGYLNKVDHNALIFRNYGVDNMCIAEGKSGQVDICFVAYKWNVTRIVGEFCRVDGTVDDRKIGGLPDQIKQAYAAGDYNKEFHLVFGMMPSETYNPRKRGKAGARYKGVWFMDDSERKVFHEEYFKEKPISVCRQIKVRGEVYGRSSGTMLLSSVRSVNFMISTVIEILEKMANPSLGVFSNALFGDSVLDTSPNGLTVFNPQQQAGTQSPAFPIFDVGDPSGIIQFLVPYLNEKISTAFKVDTLLDFNSAKEMTATESLQRYSIRGKSLSGLLQQQKGELLEPLVKRCIGLLFDIGEMGVDPRNVGFVERAMSAGRQDRIIPQPVIDVIASGRPWYEIEFNNELEKLTRTETVDNLVQVLQAVGGIAGMYPQIVGAVDWYDMLRQINDNLDKNNQVLLDKDAFMEQVAQAAQQQEAMMQLQGAEQATKVQKNEAQANINNARAQAT